MGIRLDKKESIYSMNTELNKKSKRFMIGCIGWWFRADATTDSEPHTWER
jgi:hypothetical protein